MSAPPPAVVRLALLLACLVGVVLPALLLVLAEDFLLLLAAGGALGAAVVFFLAVGAAAATASPSFFFVVAVTADAAVLFFVVVGFSPLPTDDATEAFVSGLTMVSLLIAIPAGTNVAVSELVLMKFVPMNAKYTTTTKYQMSDLFFVVARRSSLVVCRSLSVFRFRCWGTS